MELQDGLTNIGPVSVLPLVIGILKEICEFVRRFWKVDWADSFLLLNPPSPCRFQIGIALMSGPRFMLVFLSSLLVSLSKPSSYHAIILVIVGSLRTLACGGWVFVTSSDDHDVHDIAMGLYLILTPPWMYITSGSLAPQPNKESMTTTLSKDLLANQARRMRRFAAGAFFGMTPFMIFFFYRHKVRIVTCRSDDHLAHIFSQPRFWRFQERIPAMHSLNGVSSYLWVINTKYVLIDSFLSEFKLYQDLLYDCASTYDLSRLELHIVEARNPSGGEGSSSKTGQTASLMGGEWIKGGTTAAVSSGAWSTTPQEVSSSSQEKYVGKLLPR